MGTSGVGIDLLLDARPGACAAEESCTVSDTVKRGVSWTPRNLRNLCALSKAPS